MLFISTEIFDKLRPQILSVGTTANSPLKEFKLVIFLCLINIKSQSLWQKELYVFVWQFVKLNKKNYNIDASENTEITKWNKN